MDDVAEMNPDGAGRLPRRRWLLGAAALPGTLALAGCGDIPLPFLPGSRDPGVCLGPSEELPEEVYETIPEGMIVDPAPPDENRRFTTSALALSPDGTMLAACESRDRVHLELEEEFGVILWDTASGDVLRRITPPAHGVIAWHPDGTRLAIGASRHISVVDLEGNPEWNLIGHELPSDSMATIRDLAFSSDGSQLASSSSDGSVRLWDMSAETCSEEMILEPGPRSNASLSYSPDGTVLAMGSTSSHGENDPDNPPQLWDPVTGERRSVLEDPAGIVYALGHDADGSLLVVTDEPAALSVIAPDGTVQGGPVTASTWFAELAVGPRGRVALLGADDELLLWDRESGEETRLETDPDVGALCWSADGEELYALSRSQGVIVWDGETWRQFELP